MRRDDSLNGRMEELPLLVTFVAVARGNSFSAAAQQLGVAASVVSKHIARLEKILGGRLFNRSTRRIALTEVGVEYLATCERVIGELNHSRDWIARHRSEPSGLLRVTSPIGFGTEYLASALGRFIDRFPRLRIELHATDHVVDLEAGEFDVAIRLTEQPSSNVVARPITHVRHILAASPTYLAHHPAPQTPDDLGQHRCLTFPTPSPLSQWRFQRGDGVIVVRPEAVLSVNNALALRNLAVQGQGLVVLPSYLLQDDIRGGRLVELLLDYRARSKAALYAMYSPNRYGSFKRQVFVDFVVEMFSGRFTDR
jgi:DNA-binding transcriptional LysR family regulator